ncbi:MAG TPA: YceI family protein [Gaiellaceae bacterium]|nr:YceI family protein [Gaiellaceae bacterium]
MSILAESPATVMPAGAWSIDPVWSSLEFEVRKIGLIPIKGRVPGFAGTIQGGESPSIQGTVEAASITTFDGTRDGHLQSPDFFDVERYPELRFESTDVDLVADELVVTGNLTIKGTTKPVELRGTFLGAGADAYGNDRIGLELEATVDRTDFGLNWNAPLPGGGFLLPNDVVLKATFAAVRQA